jgi:hypothetical protein
MKTSEDLINVPQRKVLTIEAIKPCKKAFKITSVCD